MPPSAAHPRLGLPAMFTLAGETGDMTMIPVASARATVVEFWATDCQTCKQGLPALVGKADAWKGEGIELVLVGVLRHDETTESAKAVLQSWGISRPFLVDRGGAIQAMLNVDKLPATLVLDAGGTLRWAAPAGAGLDPVATAAKQIAARQ
jgi:hypothetical protein